MDSDKEVHIYHADAGSGKTTKLMSIIEQLVQEGTPLDRIAFVTYTKAAATVAQRRICDRFGINLSKAPHFRTIHSMCFRALGVKRERMMDPEKYRDFGIKAGYSFKISVGRQLLDDVDWHNLSDTELVTFEQLYRNNTKQAQWLLDNKIDNIDFTKYCAEYTKYKKTFGYTDFTDLLSMYIDKDCVEPVEVACIDEAQDCTPLQWQVLFKAFRNCKKIFVAGDAKQSIYSFNGGDPWILLHLRGEQHYLDRSWRVPYNINKFVNEHIVRDMPDITHHEWTSANEGGTISYITNCNEVGTIHKNETYLLLARNRKFLVPYKEWCESLCIPYELLGKPVFTNEEKMQYRDGLTGDWDKEKLFLARRYIEAGTFYATPNVRIDTIHGVKGDEADNVILTSDISKLTWKDYEDDPSNEHRVFYVACTRARHNLYILEPCTKFYYAYIF